MKFSKGRTRFVFAFPLLGFVIKFPRMNLGSFFRLIRDIYRYGWENEKLTWLLDIDNEFSVKRLVLGGIRANWFEWIVWRKTHYKLLCPTWLSFFGLINVQKYGEPLQHGKVNMCKTISEITNGDSVRVGHGFESACNYCERNGHVQMIDYGCRRLWPVIEKYHQEISRLTVQDCLREQATGDD